MQALDSVVLFGGEPRVRLTAFEPGTTTGSLLTIPAHHTWFGFPEGLGALPEKIEKVVHVLERDREVSEACATLRDALIELVGGATPGPRVRAVCDPFTPWGMTGTPQREH